jgi:hypothetical protein
MHFALLGSARAKATCLICEYRRDQETLSVGDCSAAGIFERGIFNVLRERVISLREITMRT